jgi:hypothetical protein
MLEREAARGVSGEVGDHERGAMMATPYIEFIPKAGACLATTNVSHIDTSEYLNDGSNWKIVDFNELCAIEPALIGIWDLLVGSDLQLVDDERGIRIVDTAAGREVPRERRSAPASTRPASRRR